MMPAKVHVLVSAERGFRVFTGEEVVVIGLRVATINN
jgi:hypothetical protein